MSTYLYNSGNISKAPAPASIISFYIKEDVGSPALLSINFNKKIKYTDNVLFGQKSRTKCFLSFPLS